MTDKIKFSINQLGIISEIAEIYNDNLTKNIDMFYSDKPNIWVEFINEAEQELGTSQSKLKDSLEENIHNDFFKHCDLKARPSSLIKLELMDLVIIKFIANEWSEEKSWDKSEIQDLLIKLDSLIHLKGQS